MAQRLQELCALLVEESCGHLSSQIFLALAQNGRLTRLHLQQTLRIPARQLRHALSILIQQHILLHNTTEEGLTFYHVDWRNAYYLVRSNSIISLTRDRYGESAARIVTSLIQLGHARVGDLAQAFDFTPTSKRDSGVDSCNEHVNCDTLVNPTYTHDSRKINTLGHFHTALRTLLKAGFLKKITKRSYLPAADLEAEIEELVIQDQFPDRKITGPKKQAEFKLAVNTLKRKWREANDYSDHRDLVSSATIRRPGNQSAKRVKLNGSLSNGVAHHHDSDADESAPKLPNELVLRVNYAQFNLALRSKRLEDLAEPYLGGVTAAVYAALLQALEGKLKARDDDVKEDCEDEDEDDHQPSASVGEIAELLDPTVDLTLGVVGAADEFQLSNGESKKAKKLVPHTDFGNIGIKMEVDDDDHPISGFSSYHARAQKLALIEEHLKLLHEHPKTFCVPTRGAGGGEWRVHFSALTDNLIQADVDMTVMARFGKVHTRLIRLLRERGRLDEKQVASFSMMRVKDVRAILTELKFAGLVEGQEVPKDSARQPTRSLYLWFHDQDRVAGKILQETYQAMSRTLQRLKVEQHGYKTPIEKAQNMGMKQEALTQKERAALMQWRETEEKLLTQLERMDDVVALLRDFSGKDTSLVS
ncbi:hypothetical protein AC578_9700 [Pseudocercospora eumusae]|uniref:DNA-directed RNA polymerase III subunit RPC3 n=1 Tax=Pseudocercospora eumusae TaxID=321146 RepID=A0A139HQL3_9PEZI|nr:hypothetical protein AC578_9700 [Pseudocercospora eumusae]